MWQVVERITNERDLGGERVKWDDAVTPSTGFQSGREGNDCLWTVCKSAFIY